MHTIVVGFDDGKFPEELVNESYLFLNMKELLDDMEKVIERGDTQKLVELQKKLAGQQ